MATTNFKGITIQLDIDSDDFESKLKKCNRAIDDFDRQLKKVNDALKINPRAYDLLGTKTDLLKEKQIQLKNNINQFQKALDGLKAKGVEETDKRVIDLRTSLVKAKKELGEINAELFKVATHKITQPLEAFEKATKKASEELKKLSMASGALLGGSTKIAIDFEDAFAGVKKTVDETTKISYADLENSIIELSKVLPSSADSIAEIVSLAGQLGVPTENVIEFSKAMIDLGNSTNLTAQDAGTMIAQFFNVTHGDLKNVENFSSALVELGNNSATTEADIMQLAFRLAGAGSNLGFTQQQILALSTALASAGLKAEAAGGSMSTVLQNIQKEVSGTPWGEANDGLKVWGDLIGVTGKQFKKMWGEDTYGTFQKVIYGLGTFKDEGGDVTSKLAEMGIETIRTTDSMSRLISASENLAKYTRMANDAFSDGTALQEEANKRYETTKSQLQILGNNLKAIGITIGKNVLPVINKFVKKAVDVIDKNQDWIKSNSVLITKTLAFASALSPALKIMSNISGKIKTFTGETLPNAIGWLSKFTPETLALGSAFGVVGLATAGATAYIASFTKEATAMGEKIRETQLALQQYKETSRQNYETINANTATRLSEIDYYKTLAEELFNLVDSNGKVKEGYENRYNYIVNELVQAGIIERDNIDQTIKKQDELKESIDKTIEAQQNEAIMEGATEKYQQAMADKKQAADWLRESWEDVLEAKKVLADYENNEFSKYTLQEYENAKKTLETYQQMEQMSKDSNLIIDNYNAMKRAYDDGDTERLLTLYYQQEYDLMDKKEDEIHEMLKGKMDEILKLRSEMDTDDPMWQDMISATETEFEEMAKAVGLSVDQAYQYVNQYVPSLLDKANAIKGALSAFTGGAVGAIKKGGKYRIPYNATQSGGLGFASGGITSNVTINVNNNGNPISAKEVRRWASIINDELGGSF